LPWLFRLWHTRFTDFFLATEQFVAFFSGTDVSIFYS
jgi:hypothetical protein